MHARLATFTTQFSDIRGFTNLASEWPTEKIIVMLNEMFTAFDELCEVIGVYKVETIGGCCCEWHGAVGMGVGFGRLGWTS